VGFESATLAFAQAKTIHASELAATMIARGQIFFTKTDTESQDNGRG
jgi:hypothetical protein